MPSRVIVALDEPDYEECLALARRVDPKKCRVKVGKALFTQCGPKVIDSLHKLGFEIFLDLKIHDIPMQTAKTCRVCADLGVWMSNVHASGGFEMMRAAKEAVLASKNPGMKLIAVTLLTSLGENDLRRVEIPLLAEDYVSRMAALTAEAGLDGVVCSAGEASRLRQERGPSFCLVTPGIRFAEDPRNDQRRTATPEEALCNGSDYLVVGRSYFSSVERWEDVR
ncbi:MAG: orotidine-5'-phosphate decarboxylase [Deltaproteobacteria bacterium]|nr:orotidine-5'-phosphate decarboxylase [Deltaproteobacteria bacterium]